MTKKLPVGILGATGAVGRQLAARLKDHPFFELTFQAASSQAGALHAVSDLKVAQERCALIFSALPTEISKQWDPLYAEAGLGVISLSSAFRLEPDIPLIIPEINASHLRLIALQKRRRNWKGFLIAKPNCTVQGILLPLYPLFRTFGLRKVAVTTLQALSGAGHPGVSSLEMLDNLLPFIPHEEEKLESEPLKILSLCDDEELTPPKDLFFGAHCTRVAVLSGHTACLSIQCGKQVEAEEIVELWESFRSPSLPSAPQRPLLYQREENRPQPRLDRDREGGMGVTIGRLRRCPLFDFRFVTLSHNLERGGAGGAVLTAELLYTQGYVP